MRNTTFSNTRQSSRLACLVLLFCFFLQPLAGLGQDVRVFFGNLHSHTLYSDGIGTPKEAYRHARNIAKVDFLALTEHNHAKAMGRDGIRIAANHAFYNGGSKSLRAAAEAATVNGRFVALYGQEYSVIKVGNHVNVFEVPRVITAASGRFDELAAFLGSTSDSGGQLPIIMFNHPKNTTTIQPLEYGLDDFGGDQGEWLRRIGPHAALMQMINGPGQRAGVGMRSARPAEAAYKKFLSLGFKLAPTADQDNHTRNWGNATHARTAVIAPSLNRQAILDAMRQRHVYATEDRNLQIVLRVNGRLCGDVMPPVATPREANITFSISDPDEPSADYEIQVWRGTVGGPAARMVTAVVTAEGSGTIEDVALSGGPEFFFFKIIQTDIDQDDEDVSEDESWTAPVWFENPNTDMLPAGVETTEDFVASRRSKVYHLTADCLDARRIKASNRITGRAAREGRILHDDCPRRSDR